MNSGSAVWACRSAIFHHIFSYSMTWPKYYRDTRFKVVNKPLTKELKLKEESRPQSEINWCQSVVGMKACMHFKLSMVHVGHCCFSDANNS